VNIEYSKTLCVILHYGSEEYTNKCLNSLLNQKQLDIVILDNDPSQSYELPTYTKKFARIFKTGGAVGFSESNNRGNKSFLILQIMIQFLFLTMILLLVRML
jgi:GT2 family glycosyltransferase